VKCGWLFAVVTIVFSWAFFACVFPNVITFVVILPSRSNNVSAFAFAANPYVLWSFHSVSLIKPKFADGPGVTDVY
jgi:hypothetical protein